MSDVQKIGTGSYVVAGLGFIPLIGIPFAIIAIILGGVKWERGGKRLVVLGGLGIALTVLLYSTLFYKAFVERGGVYDDLRSKLGQATINDLVKSIEYYKMTNSHYPDSLMELQDASGKESLTLIYDPSVKTDFSSKKVPTFFYQLTADKTHYYLLGVGVDQKPLTSDDIVPNLSEQERLKTGLLIHGSEITPAVPQ
jgi:hypothetical protein